MHILENCPKMKKPIKTGIFIFAVLTLCSYGNSKDKFSRSQNTESIYKDSIVRLSNRILRNSNINPKKAKQILNSHFKSKGVLIQSELDFGTFDPDLPKNADKKAIEYIKIYPLHLIRKRAKVAIISYYECGPFENGHCVEPHYAIFANTSQGLKIVNKDFLPHNFVIERIKGCSVFGYYYECANLIELQHYKVFLE